MLALGIAVFVISFLIPTKTKEDEATEFSEEVIKEMVGKEVESAKGQLNDIVDETISYAMEKTERSLDRITNEKMMAVNEYSDTVLNEINKNHKEVVFLYDMLNDKHENLKDTVSEVDKKTTIVKQAMMDAEITARETKDAAEEAKGAAEEAAKSAVEAMNNTRGTALDRLRELQSTPEKTEAPAEVGYDDSFSPIVAERLDEDGNPLPLKPARKKRTTKPKVKEEAVVLGDAADMADVNLKSNLDLIKSPDIPNLNFGDDPIGKAQGGRNNNERILELHTMGKSNMAIAKELGLGIGEVKFVIDLFEGK